MSYRLKNSAATFKRVVNKVLEPHIACARAYIDKVTTYSKLWEDDIKCLRKGLQTNSSAGLMVNPERRKFSEPKVNYLGHMVGPGSHSPDPEGVSAILRFKAPKIKQDL